MLIVAFAVVASLLLATYVVPHLLKLRARAALDSLCRARRQLVLTYDDGPTSDFTPQVLARLEERGAKATFFMTGSRALAAKETVAQVVGGGHEIGSHSARHVHPWRSFPWSSQIDMRDGFRALAPQLSEKPLFRPPYGKLLASTWIDVLLRGGRVAWWTLVSGDTHDELPKVSSVVDALVERGGGVVLMHDMHSKEAARRFVLEATSALLDAAAREKIRVVTFGSLFDAVPANARPESS